MTIQNLVHFFYKLTYFFLAAQGVFYLLCFSRVFGEGSPLDFIRMRKKAAPILEPRLSLLYYSCLATGAITVGFAFREPFALYAVATIISFAMLLTDVVLAKRYNIPINSIIELASVDSVPLEKAADLQKNWIRWIVLRGRIMIAGFILLLLQNVWFS
ncbi:MAG: hypothetical protein EOO04_10100 [Chitinophagaceae bacterium]|nr:MAG: hypothetical protein EOO04_10100 [Chitinophagaceae bacterium]